MLGIIGAMDEEVTRIIEQMEAVIKTEKASMTFYKGLLAGKEAVVVRSGIGKVNAGICTQILVDDFQIDAVINTGIAGSLKHEINIGDMVLSTDALQHDMDATGFGYALGQIPRMETLAFPADKKLMELAEKCCKAVNPEIQVFTGRVLSGDQFIADPQKKEQLVTTYDGCCTEMEGAAIAQAAWLNQVPFLIVRAISDKADDSAGMDYATFEAKAIEHSVKLIVEMAGHREQRNLS